MIVQSPSSNLRFDPEKHQYWIEKKRIPGVSEVLQKVGLAKNYDGVDPFYAQRGIATHKAIELHLKGILDRDSLDPVVVPHFEAFLKFWGNRDEKMLALEMPMVDLGFSFAGTPDLITNKAIYDWKCSKDHDRVAELQGQAYKILGMGEGFTHEYTALPFIVVELHDDGEPVPFEYGNDIEQWSSVLDLFRWKTKKRIRSEEARA